MKRKISAEPKEDIAIAFWAESPTIEINITNTGSIRICFMFVIVSLIVCTVLRCADICVGLMNMCVSIMDKFVSVMN